MSARVVCKNTFFLQYLTVLYMQHLLIKVCAVFKSCKSEPLALVLQLAMTLSLRWHIEEGFVSDRDRAGVLAGIFKRMETIKTMTTMTRVQDGRTKVGPSVTIHVYFHLLKETLKPKPNPLLPRFPVQLADSLRS